MAQKLTNKKIKVPITEVKEQTWTTTPVGESELSKHKLEYEGPKLNSQLIKEMDKVIKQYGLWNKIKRLWKRK